MRARDAAANLSPQSSQLGLERVKLYPGNTNHLNSLGAHPGSLRMQGLQGRFSRAQADS
jgi:hypothetical protein